MSGCKDPFGGSELGAESSGVPSGFFSLLLSLAKSPPSLSVAGTEVVGYEREVEGPSDMLTRGDLAQ